MSSVVACRRGCLLLQPMSSSGPSSNTPGNSPRALLAAPTGSRSCRVRGSAPVLRYCGADAVCAGSRRIGPASGAACIRQSRRAICGRSRRANARRSRNSVRLGAFRTANWTTLPSRTRTSSTATVQAVRSRTALIVRPGSGCESDCGIGGNAGRRSHASTRRSSSAVAARTAARRRASLVRTVMRSP